MESLLAADEIRQVLARAEEIQLATLQGGALSIELEAVIEAGEAVGLARPALERAVHEQLQLPLRPPAPGDLVFARSADGKYYAARVRAVAEAGVNVRFMRGSEHIVSLDELRPCSFLPGERVVVHWPWWGPWTCTVLSYDAANERVTVSDGWGESRSFPLAEVWLNSPRKSRPGSRARTRIYATLIGAGAIVTALILG